MMKFAISFVFLISGVMGIRSNALSPDKAAETQETVLQGLVASFNDLLSATDAGQLPQIKQKYKAQFNELVQLRSLQPALVINPQTKKFIFRIVHALGQKTDAKFRESVDDATAIMQAIAAPSQMSTIAQRFSK